jgi:hypothetical protein
MKSRLFSILAVALGALGSVGVANASAAAQFHLDPQLDVSGEHDSRVAHHRIASLGLAPSRLVTLCRRRLRS